MATPTVSCPSGGSFYACASGSRYVGCCLTNPCDTGCFAGQLVPAAFDPSQYGDFADQQCNSGSYYSCIYENQNNATFLGCCKTNACSGGACPSSDLAGAFLSSNPQEAAPYLSLNSSWLATATLSGSSSLTTLTSSTSTLGPSSIRSITSTSSIVDSLTSSSSATGVSIASLGSATTAASTASLASATASSTTTIAPHPSNIGAIAGGAVGGSAVLVALILGLVYMLRRKRAHKEPPTTSHADQMVEKGAPSPAAGSLPPKSPMSASTSPYPVYSPGPPGYVFEQDTRHVSHELAGNTQYELDSGQRYHAYRPERGLGIQGTP